MAGVVITRENKYAHFDCQLIQVSLVLQVKQIEKRDSVLTSKNQIDRLTRPGSSYFNLNPFEVSFNILSSLHTWYTNLRIYRVFISVKGLNIKKEKNSLDVDYCAEGLQKTEGWCICARSLFHCFMAGANYMLLSHFPCATALEDLAD